MILDRAISPISRAILLAPMLAPLVLHPQIEIGFGAREQRQTAPKGVHRDERRKIAVPSFNSGTDAPCYTSAIGVID